MAILTANEAARNSAQRFRREFRVWLGPPRVNVQRALFRANESVTLASSTTTTSSINEETISIPVSSTSGFDTSVGPLGMGTLNVQNSSVAGREWDQNNDRWTVSFDHGDSLLLENGSRLVLETATYDAGLEYIIQVESNNGVGWASYHTMTSSSFDGIVWQHGVTDHGPGAIVTQWYDISDRVFKDTIRWEETEELPFYDYTARMRGYRYDSNIMWDDATVLVEERLDPDGSYGTFTPWQVAFIGYVQNWNPVTEYRGNNEWSADITSVSRYVFSKRIDGRKYGPTNIAENGTVTDGDSESGTTPNNLGDPSLEPDEFAGGFGDTTSDLVVDGNKDTVYISATKPTQTAETPGSYTGFDMHGPAASGPRLIIDEVFLQGPVGAPADLQYFTVKLPRYSDKQKVDLNNDKHRIAIYDRNGNKTDDFFLPQDVVLERTGDNDTESLYLVMVNDRPTFERYFGLAARTIVREWDSTANLDTTAGALHVRQEQYPGGFNNSTLEDMVAWGSWNSGFFEPGDNTNHWDDPNVVSVPTVGNSIRRSPTEKDSNQASDWAEEDTPVPGDPMDRGDDVFISVDLGTFTVNPSAAMSSTYPHANMWWGFSDVGPFSPSGTIQIDGEQMTYSRKDPSLGLYITKRGANGTTPASHTTSAVVKQYDSTLGAHQLYAVDAVELIRKPINGFTIDPGSGWIVPDFIVPTHISIWGSNKANPKYPGTASYNEDWIIGDHSSVAYNGNGNEIGPIEKQNPRGSTTWKISLPQNDDTNEPFRLRHVMVRIHRMSDDGRVKLNELRVYRWPVTQISSDVRSSTFGIAQVLMELLRTVLDDAEIDTSVGTAFSDTSPTVQIREGNLRNVLEDICRETMSVIKFNVDGTVSIERDPRHPVASRPSILANLNKDDIRSPMPTSKPSRTGVGQYIVEIQSPTTDDSFFGRFPPSRGIGELKRVQLRMQTGGDGTAAQIAQALYLDDPDISQEHDFMTVGPFARAHVGSRITHPVDYDDQGSDTLNGRITSVVHNEEGVERLVVKEWRQP